MFRPFFLAAAPAILASCCLLAPTPAYADETAEFNRLYQQCDALRQAGKYQEAERVAIGMRRLAEGPLGHVPLRLADALNLQALVIESLGRYAEAEPLQRRSLAIMERELGPNDRFVAQGLNNLAMLHHSQGRYAEAEPLYKRSLVVRERIFGPNHADVAASLGNLAVLYWDQGRFAEAELFHKRSLAIREKVLGPDHPDVALSLNNLGIFYDSVQGDYAEAEPLYKRSLAIREKALGPNHPDVAQSLNNLAHLYSHQGRAAEAESLYKRSIAIWEMAVGPDHRAVAQCVTSLANLYDKQGRREEAEPLQKRALAIRERVLPPDHPEVAASLANLAILYKNQKRYAEAETLVKRALAIKEKAVGADHLDFARSLISLATLYHVQGRYAEAEPLAERAIGILERQGAHPEMTLDCYRLRAEIGWHAKRREQAVADLRRAMDLAEQSRARSSGAEQERAQSFARFAGLFEQMVDWQAELKDVAAGLEAAERGRARSLLDQMEVGRMDLLAGVANDEADRLRRQEQEARSRLASLEKQLGLLGNRTDLTATERKQQQAALESELSRTRRDYVAAYADIRNASPVYRLAVGQDRKPVSLAALQPWVDARKALLLEYLIGDDAYLLIVSAGQKPRLEKLTVTQEQAGALGIATGALSAKQLKQALVDDRNTGLLQRLKTVLEPQAAKGVEKALGALWELLIPGPERSAMVAGRYQQLIVIPDSSLAQFPFETLVVKQGDRPQYLLDVGPAICYAPSATILTNLAERKTPRAAAGIEPVLSVGDCHYGPPRAAASGSELAQLDARSRYAVRGGKLQALPYSEHEMAWVADAFGKENVPVAWLRAESATKAAVRAHAPGRRLLHFACHGLADQNYGNLFGALALTPGDVANDPADDGFLTLVDIYGLNLAGCELAILSACDTNFGPEQRGEGVWALSRGFLVAGSRRVVASDWLVDDEAAATLIYWFCGFLAEAEKAGKPPDYAAALQRAKQAVRQQDKWQSPYYWGSFVLVGPN